MIGKTILHYNIIEKLCVSIKASYVPSFFMLWESNSLYLMLFI